MMIFYFAPGLTGFGLELVGEINLSEQQKKREIWCWIAGFRHGIRANSLDLKAISPY